MSTQNTPAPATQSPVEVCEAVFGENPWIVVSHVEAAAEALGSLETLFRAIQALCDSTKIASDLAELGSYFAEDFRTAAENAHREMFEHITAANAREGGEA
jgi:hypothetical protein